ncbi:uncharacterized protein LOC119768971 [Culex quinquefasciatus]|uniref:uncharacterized protein LOC119768971 n=1 Tax=Culex quinquefasciatus TaxID=7176 RepID=UPI0018E3F78C|nr:uncharacterized protein LOC119768971 [Culex quinquefasciatus]
MSRRRQPRSSDTQLFIDVVDDKVVQVVSERPVQYDPHQPVIQRLITTPLAPTLYDGTFRHDEDGSESELSFSSDSASSVESGSGESPASVDELTLEQTGARPMFSVARMAEEERKQSISVVSKVRKHAVGAIVDPDSTVLMQLGRKDSFGHQQALEYIRNINEMLERDESVVILRYPNVQEEQSSRVAREDHVVMTRRMMELTEDVLGRVQGNSRESILMRLQQTLEEILNQDDETIVVHSYSRADTARDLPESEALVGFFQKDDDAALFVHVPDTLNRLSSSWSGSETDQQQMSLDQLKNFLQESLVFQEETMGVTMSTEPDITVSKSGNRIVAVMSFPNTSSAVLTAPSSSIPLESERSEIIQAVKDRFREVIEQPSGKLLMQLHLDESRGNKVEQMKYGLDQILRSSELPHDPSQFSVQTIEDKVIGKLSYSGGSIVIQTSSKNWARPRCHKPEDLVQSIRGVIEQFMINNELNDRDLKTIAALLVQVFYVEDVELPEDFVGLSVHEKIEVLVQQLMNPTVDEDHLSILGQIQVTLQDICQTQTADHDNASWDILKSYFEGLICEGDNEYYGDTILPVLRRGLLMILSQYENSLSSALEELVQLLKQVPNEKVELYNVPSIATCPGTTTLSEPNQNAPELDHPSLEVVQKIHNLLTTDQPSTISYLSTFHALFFAFLTIVSGWTVRVKSFLSKDPPSPSAPPLDSQPSVSKKPSVSFHLVQEPEEPSTPPDFPAQLEREQRHLNETIDSLRAYLERTLEAPKSWQHSGQGSLVEEPEPRKLPASGPDRMVQLFTQLLEQSEQLRGEENPSTNANTIHLRMESASAVLERKEADQVVMLSGCIRDRGQNVGLFFEARLMDLLGVANQESELECVMGVRRLSDDDGQEEAAAGVVNEVLEGCLSGVVRGTDELERKTKLEQEWRRYFEQIQNHIEVSIDPLRDALEQILEKLGASKTGFEDDYLVELAETVQSEPCKAIAEEVIYASKSVQFEESTKSASSVPSVRSTSDRLMTIEGDLRELKQLMQLLLASRQYELMTPEASMDSAAAEQIILSCFPSQESESDLETLYASALECTDEQLAELQREELAKLSRRFETELGEVLETTRSIGTMVEQMSKTRLVRTVDVAVQLDGMSLEELAAEEPLEETTVEGEVEQQRIPDVEEILEVVLEDILPELHPKDVEEAVEPIEAEVVQEREEPIEATVTLEAVQEEEPVEPATEGVEALEISEALDIIQEEAAELPTETSNEEDATSEIVLEPEELPEVVEVTQEPIAPTLLEPAEPIPVEEIAPQEESGIATPEEVEEELPKVEEPVESNQKVLEMIGFVEGSEVTEDQALEEPLQPDQVTDVEAQPIVEKSPPPLEEVVAAEQAFVESVKQPSETEEVTVLREIIAVEMTQEDRRPSEVSIVVIEPDYSQEEEIAMEEVADPITTVMQSLEEPRPNLATEDLLQRDDSHTSTDKSVDISEQLEVAETLEASQEAPSDVPDDKQEQASEQPAQNLQEPVAEEPKSLDKPLEPTEERISRTSFVKPSPMQEGDHATSTPRTLCELAFSYQCQWAAYHKGASQRFACPAGIISCHRVGPDQLMLHWDVAARYLDQIDDFKIYVDGQEHRGYFSSKRRRTLISEINTAGEHLISIYPTPKKEVSGGNLQWAPGFFVYHQ